MPTGYSSDQRDPTHLEGTVYAPSPPMTGGRVECPRTVLFTTLKEIPCQN